MKRYKFKRPPIQSNLILQYFVTNMHNMNLPGVNSKDLSESFCLITTKFFFTTTIESVIANLIRLHVSLSTICCTLTLSDALARFYGGGRQRLAWAQRPVGEGRLVMSLSGRWAYLGRTLSQDICAKEGHKSVATTGATVLSQSVGPRGADRWREERARRSSLMILLNWTREGGTRDLSR